MPKIRKGDTVQVIAGKDKGVTGKVISILVEKDRVIVEGVNQIKKHTKVSSTDRGVRTGGIITTEASIHISNVLVLDEDGRATRMGSRKDEKGKNVRISRRTGKDIR